MVRNALINAMVVGSGGFIGAVLRYGLSGLVQSAAPWSSFPWGTLAVNLLGCLLIGVVAGLVEARQLFSPEVRLFILIGVLGGFTTYSTFAYETLALLRDAEHLRAFSYVASHVIAGLAMAWAGFSMVTARWTSV